jgi:hypothetical protein
VTGGMLLSHKISRILVVWEMGAILYIGCHVNICKNSIKNSVFTWYNGNSEQRYNLLQDSSTERYVKYLASIFVKYLQVTFCSSMP